MVLTVVDALLSPTKGYRTTAPSNQDPAETRVALSGLFEVIEHPLIQNTPAVSETLESEMEKIADILRLIMSYCCSIKVCTFSLIV